MVDGESVLATRAFPILVGVEGDVLTVGVGNGVESGAESGKEIDDYVFIKFELDKMEHYGMGRKWNMKHVKNIRH